MTQAHSEEENPRLVGAKAIKLGSWDKHQDQDRQERGFTAC